MSERVQSGRAREGRVGGVVMVECVDFFFSKHHNAIATECLSYNMRRKQYFWTLDLSNTPDVTEGGCEASELALPSG